RAFSAPPAPPALLPSTYLVTLESVGAIDEVVAQLAPIAEIARLSARALVVRTLQPSALLEVLRAQPKVVFVEESADALVEPIKRPITVEFNLNARITHNVRELRKRYDISGKGVTVGVWDGGPVFAAHADFGGRVEVRAAGEPHEHATHVAGTIGATGLDP